MMQTPHGFVPPAQPTTAFNLATDPLPADPVTALVFRHDELLVDAASLTPPGLAELAYHFARDTSQPSRLSHWQNLGDWADQRWMAGTLQHEGEAPEGLAFRKLRSLFGVWPMEQVAMAGRGYQLTHWAATHRFCGACGTPTVMAEHERCLRCPACGHSAYPRISPAMMVLVKRGDAILLACHAASPARYFTALAGFVEAGESLEETVHREVREEVGLRVKNLEYFGSQSWPFPHSLMVAFTAEYDGGDITVQPDEIAEARWFGPGDEIPRTPPGISIASALIQANLPAGCELLPHPTPR